jgi:hypothetical protein
MQTNSNTDDIMQFFSKHIYLIETAMSVGEFDLCALVYGENITSLNENTEAVRRRFGIRKVIVNVWANIPHMTFENLDLIPTKQR